MLKKRYSNKSNTDTSESFQHPKKDEVHRLFKHVATTYRPVNDIVSLGLLRYWRNIFASRLNPTENTELIDVAGGTGEIVFRILDYIKRKGTKDCHVTLCDINEHMLDQSKYLCEKWNYNPALVTWVKDDAENLSFKNNSFNMYTISFGSRYMSIEKMLNEAYRVLQPGGRFFCLEFSRVENSILNWLFSLYCSYVLPILGYITGHTDVLKVLVRTIRQFPDQEAFKAMIENAGFQHVTYENLSGGIVAIHSGLKL